MADPKVKQVEVAELREAIQHVLEGGDPLDFVNAFFRCPPEVPSLPSEYWMGRVCCVAELLSDVGKTKPVGCIHGI